MHSSTLRELPATIRIATRKSALALVQTQLVVAALRAQRPIEVELVPITSDGDVLADRSLATIGGDGVFVKALMAALLDGRADIAVHSLKDVPTDLPAAVAAGVVPEREDARDVLISAGNRFAGLGALPAGATVGTSSLRRAAQVRRRRRDLEIVPLRGNVDTRVRKVLDGNCTAAVLALAGLKRIDLLGAVGGGTPLDYDEMVPAAGQGALFVQCRAEDLVTKQLIAPLQHEASADAVRLERAFLRRCGGGCVVPLGIHVAVAGAESRPEAHAFAWTLHVCIASPDGTRSVRRHRTGTAGDAAEAQAQVEAIADEMLAAGGRQIIAGGAA